MAGSGASGSRRRGLGAGGFVVCALLACLLSGCATVSAAAAQPMWSSAHLIDPGPAHGTVVALTGVSCPSVSFCVAVDQAGDVLTSTDPTGGAARWRVMHVDRGRDFQPSLTGVSCPSLSLCVAVDDFGDVLTSTAPSGPAASWKLADVDRGKPSPPSLTGVSCPSTSLCVAVDDSGSVLSSTDPTGGRTHWTRARVQAGHGYTAMLDAISCPTVSLCVAVTFKRRVIVSSNPTAGADGWSTAPVNGANGLAINSVSCASASLCVAADQDEALQISTSPAAGTRAWTVKSLNAAPLSAVSCATNGWCAAVDDSGDVFESGSPGDPQSGWRRVRADANNELSAVSCPASQTCVAVDQSGNAVVTSPSTAARGVPQLIGHARSFLRAGANRLVIARGLDLRCPAGGPVCTITGAWSVNDYLDRSASAAFSQQIRPGTQRPIAFHLTQEAGALLRHHTQVAGDVTYTARAGREHAVAQTFAFILTR